MSDIDSNSGLKERIFLIGMMGSGKSTVGKLLATKMDYYFIDLDELIERSNDKKIPKIFKEKGEAAFRKMEQDALMSMSGLNELVVACGGGTNAFENNMDWMLKNGTVIFLNTSIDTLTDRLKNENLEKRPVLMQRNDGSLKLSLSNLFKEREKSYLRANYKVTTDLKGIGLIVDEILKF